MTTAAAPVRLARSMHQSKAQKMVRQGVFRAEMDEFFKRVLFEDGYSNVDVRFTPQKTEIIIMATKTQNVLGDKGRRIRELTSLVQKRFNLAEGTVEVFADKVTQRGLSAVAQCESLRFKLEQGLPVRRACYGVLRYIMECEAKGCEVVVSGKLRGQRAKAMKFSEGLMIHSGHPTEYYIDEAVRHVKLRQGVLGIKVKIMKQHDESGQLGPKRRLPDNVTVFMPKDEPAEVEVVSKVVNAQIAPQQPAAAVAQQPVRSAPPPQQAPVMQTMPALPPQGMVGQPAGVPVQPPAGYDGSMPL